MKKFTFMMIALLASVVTFAAGPKKQFDPQLFTPTKGSMQLGKQYDAKQSSAAPTKKAAAFKLQAPGAKLSTMAKRAGAKAKKAPKKVEINDVINSIVGENKMLVSEHYEYDDGLVEGAPAKGGVVVSVSKVDDETIAIDGFTSQATEAILAKVALTTDEELLSYGVVATITIEEGQTLLTEEGYGTVVLANASVDGDISGYVFSDGEILIDNLWYDRFADGEYEGYMYSGFIYYSSLVSANGTMEWTNSSGVQNVNVYITQDPEAPKTATVYNFADWETAIDVSLKENKTFVIESQLVEDGGSTYGEFYTFGLSDDNKSLISLTGVGTETTLTFDCKFTAYSPTSSYWYGENSPAVITLTEGEFVYPIIPDVAATPDDPEILAVNNYDKERGYGSVAFTIPTTDVDGNDLKESKLFYQLYSDIQGDIQPITFTPEICEKLTEDMTIIPYAFTDNWDFADQGSYKVVFLNYNFNALYDRIGVKSIYTGGEETNESEIAWEEIEKPAVPGGEFTFDFNKMDVPTSSTVTTDGDITEDVEITEGDVTLTITPKTSGKTENRFWSTTAGPQLRVYSGTLTFEATEGLTITQIVFNHSGNWGANTVEGVVIPNDADTKVATWTGEAQKVVVDIAGNSQINSIVVTAGSAPEPIVIEYTIAPEEGEVESLKDFTITFNTSDITLAEDALASIVGTSVDSDVFATANLTLEGNVLTVDFPEPITNPDDYKLVITGVKDADGKDIELGFNYTIKTVNQDVTFNFNTMDVATSSSESTDGDITEDVEITEGDVTLTITPKTSGKTENRFWSTTAGPQLRVYSGTLTFSVPEGCSITQIEFNHNGKWGANTAAPGEIENDEDSNVATWTGDAQQVVVTIAANSQINSILVTVKGESKPGPGPEPGDLTTVVYDFEDGTMQGWTTIDADGDGFDWTLGASPSINTVNDSDYSVYSESYSSDAGALTPDNYLVSPQIKLDGSISFYACAQDGEWAAEHFAVAVSTKGNTDAADFTNVQEWTMTASRVDNPSFAPGKFRSPRKTPGAWYKYTVDLSSYEGAEGYVAIRHFDCTDNFYIVVDDIEIKTSHVTMPDFTISPAEGVVESLSDFEITFNNYDIVIAEDAAATLKNTTTQDTYVTSFDVEENKILISYEEVTEPGDYTLTVTGVKTAEGEDVELSFNYTIEAAPEVVVLPEGLEADTWYFSATASESSVRNQEVAIAIDGSDIYIQGLNIDFLPEAWVKGTIEGNTATFPTGQYFGAFEYNTTSYDMFFLGYDSTTKEVTDVVFTIDEEAGKMTTDQMIVINGKKDVVSSYEYYYDVVITHEIPETPDLVVLPEGVEAEDWTIDGTYTDSWGGNNIVQATEVAFDGSDIYVKGLASYFEDSWIKGTINAETGIATFPSGQFVGEDEYGWEFMVGSEDFETLCDIEFEYDAEAQTLTQLTPYIIENGDDPDVLSAYGYWSDVIIYAGEPIYEEPIEAPEGLVTDTYLFTAVAIENGAEDLARKVEGEEDVTEVTFNFNEMDVAVSSGTGDSYDPAGEITEPLVLVQEGGDVTLTISPKDESATTPNRFWGTNNGPQLRVYSGTLTFEVPEGSTMTQIVFNNAKWNSGNSADCGEFENATWTGEAQKVVVSIAGNTQINSIAVTVISESGEEPEPVVTEAYSHQMQVGFDGNDVYFKGVSNDTDDLWLKGTLSEDGKTVTIPANQYMGDITILWYTFPYYFAAIGEDGKTTDVVLNYDAENSKFTTNQIVVLHDGKRSLGEPYQIFTDVEITKMIEFAATPADPSFDELSLGGAYPKAYFIVPAEDVDGNALMTSKLFYTVWYEENGEEKQFTVLADEYDKVPEDMTEIPYDYNDNYDIYKGGEIFYFNPIDVVANWTKVGIQSIYYGGGERNVSNIVWSDGSLTTGIVSINAENVKSSDIFDLQGRRVAKTTKGLYIMDGKKVVVK